MATYVADGLYAWTLGLENGETRHVFAMSLASCLGGALPAPVISAVRGAALDPDNPPPPPAISALVPASATIGDPSFTLHVQGSGFVDGDVILWNGNPEPTTFVSATELTTGVNMTTAQVPMAIPVAVRAVWGKVSNVTTFDLQAP